MAPRKSKLNDMSDSERKQRMMWQLWEVLWKTMMDRLQDPEAVVRGSTMATVVEFLKLNGTYLNAEASDKKNMQSVREQMQALYDGLPFKD